MLDPLVALADLPGWQICLAATWLLLQGAVLPSVPEEVVVSTLGVLASQGRVSFSAAIVAVFAGLVPANAFAVYLGGRLESGLARLPLLRGAIRSAAVEEARAAVRRNGIAVVVATRFTPLVRGPVYLACGASGMAVTRFVAVDAATALVQVPMLLWIGARVGAGSASLAEAMGRAGLLAAALAVLAFASWSVRRTLRRGDVIRAGGSPESAPP